jgi:two-component sensor histidine kinase
LHDAVGRAARGAFVRFEAEMFGANERRADVDLSIKPIVAGGRAVALIVEARDVTEKKRTEDLVRRSLRDKEILLQEVHHRVKNNLQVVSSMLNLQAAHAPDTATKSALQEAVSRIRSMALVHEKLYRSDDLGGINFADYAGTLASQIFRTLAPPDGRVALRTDVTPIPLTVARAVPLALILNELVSNALKHAFPDERKGVVEVRLARNGDVASLEVADDGVGFAGPFSQVARSSLGLTLVDALARQLQAEVVVTGPPGTRVAVRFALDPTPAGVVREATNS